MIVKTFKHNLAADWERKKSYIFLTDAEYKNAINQNSLTYYINCLHNLTLGLRYIWLFVSLLELLESTNLGQGFLLIDIPENLENV